jgi:PBP1b-binding outer membrane lipoprotein LpoB
MRVLAILALALLLAGCNGDRMKQGMNVRQAQPQTTGLLT